jgi:homotetrameric cytidine deaminase
LNNWDDIERRSYSEYSGRISVCIVRGKTEQLYPGVRIENASFPLTITATQAGIFSCLSEGDSPTEIHYPDDSGDEHTKYFAELYHVPYLLNAAMPKGHFFAFSSEIPTEFRARLLNLHKNCLINESNFAVSCIIVSNKQSITGVNLEFTDWQKGLCAERVAISKAISNGIRNFDEIHITASKGEFISPCGACRQVLVEFMPYKRITLYHPDGTQSSHLTADLLPGFFNGNSIKK